MSNFQPFFGSKANDNNLETSANQNDRCLSRRPDHRGNAVLSPEVPPVLLQDVRPRLYLRLHVPPRRFRLQRDFSDSP